MPNLAICGDFLEALDGLPQAQRKKVRAFTKKFQQNPTLNGLNYEPLHEVKDHRVHSVRIDQSYRAIVVQPKKGDLYLLAWVDHHDEAMAWAKKKRFEVNPTTGALQVVSIAEKQETAPSQDAQFTAPGLFGSFDDGVLLSFGVPQVLLPSVRAVMNPASLEALVEHLPAEAAEALQFLAAGFAPDEIREALSFPATAPKVDTSDFEKALQHPDSRRRFVTNPTPEDLDAMLSAPLATWRVFLHPSQERLVRREFNGPAQVLGGAGTGKTVVAMHRARHLARRIGAGEEGKLLFTTFTVNLARNIQKMLQSLCGEEIEQIEVVHLHAWAANFLREHGVQFTIAEADEQAACWSQAQAQTGIDDWDLNFIRQEWEAVVQANGLETLQEYLRTPRFGRRVKLSRPQRARLWQVFAAYREAMAQRGKWEWEDVSREARRYLEEHHVVLPYRAVVVDEAQDFREEDWRLVRAMVPEGPNDIFLVGDAHQRLYGRKLVLTRLGLNIRGRASRLRINYRTTEQIRDWAVAMLHGLEVDDLDGGTDTQAGYKSLRSGPPPEVRCLATAQEEGAFLLETIEKELQTRQPEEICLVARTSALVQSYGSLLETAGIPHVVLTKHSDEGAPGVRVATIHRVKGLEFPCLIVAGANKGVLPLAGQSDEEGSEAKERCLLYVAVTRARDRLVVTTSGAPSPYLLGLA